MKEYELPYPIHFVYTNNSFNWLLLLFYLEGFVLFFVPVTNKREWYFKLHLLTIWHNTLLITILILAQSCIYQIGFLDDTIWADGLLVFYEVFRYLEGAMVRLKNTKIGLLPLQELQRTEAFERDLDHYLGKGWRKNYSPRYIVVYHIEYSQWYDRIYYHFFFFYRIISNEFKHCIKGVVIIW